MEIIDISNPVTLILVLAVLIFLLIIGKTTKSSYVTAAGLIALLALLVYYIICLRNPDLAQYEGTLRNCLALNFIFIFIGFFAYLWVDDIEAKAKNKKSYDNSLDWFWQKH